MTDLAIYIALNEEFDAFLEVWPTPTRVREAPDAAIVTHEFEIPQRGSDAVLRVVAACPGAMGTERAAAVSSYLIKTFKPRYFAVVGIAGAISRDLKIGDVVVAKSVRNYLANSAAVDNNSADGWEYQWSANTFHTDPRFLSRLNNFDASYQPGWLSKFQNTSDLIDERMPGLLRAQADQGVVHLPPQVHANEIVVASGPTVGKSASFLNWLKSGDRKIAALDMESAGIMELSQLHLETKFIVMRSISDFADNRKTEMESNTRGELRTLAMENCASLLLSCVEGGLISESHLTTAVPEPKEALHFTDQFQAFLEATEMIFQHPHKGALKLSDIFIFPDLAPIDDVDSTVKLDLENSGFLLNVSSLPQKIAILGHSQAGKTSLAKMLAAKYLQQDCIPIVLNGASIQNKNISRLLRSQLKFQFGAQAPIHLGDKRTIVLIDDYDQIKLNKRVQADIFRQLEEVASSVITFTQTEARVASANLILFEGFEQYSILKFGHMRRSELLRRWISAGREDEISTVELLTREDELTIHINSILLGNVLPARPFYLLVALQTVETAHTVPGQQLTSYGTCYQALILQAFSRAGIPLQGFDAQLNYLSELAYFMFSAGANTLDKGQIAKFEEAYGAQFIFSEADCFFEAGIRSGVLSEAGELYKFRHRFMQYFFCARYLADNYERAEVREIVEGIISNIHLERNAKIAVFLTHHSKNQSVLDGITLTAMACFEDLTEATLNPEETSHFRDYDEISPSIVLEQREAEEERQRNLVERDKRDALKATIADGEEEVDGSGAYNRLLADMHASFRAVELIGQVLRNRYGSFRRDQLVTMAEEAINTGLRALRQHQVILSDHRDVFEKIVQDLLREDSGESDEVIAERAKNMYLVQCYWVSFAFLEKISEMLGYKRLIEIFEEIGSGKQESTAMNLIVLSMKLNAEKVVPRRLISSLHRQTRSDPVGQRLLRQMVVRYLYLNETTLQDRDWLVSELGLPTTKRKQILLSQRKKAS